MKRMTYFVMALALVLGLAQCKKEKIEPQNEGNSVMITLDVTNGNNNSSRAEVVPPSVNFVDGDQILVAYDGKYVGTLERSTSGGVSQFSGNITITENVDNPQPLYFYFLGNNQGALETGATICTVNISDQTKVNDKPVISMGVSKDPTTNQIVNYPTSDNSYSSRLYNKASLMKFNVTAGSDAAICITGMNNKVTVEFGKKDETGTGLGTGDTNNGFSYSMDETDGGLIKMPGKDAEGVTWAIVLPQGVKEEGNEGTAFTEDGVCVGQRPAIHAIEPNKYYYEGNDAISMAMGYTTLGTPLTFEAKEDGTRITYSPYDKNNVHMEYSTDNGATWIPTTGGNIPPIPMQMGQKVMFRASSPNTALATSSKYTSFDCNHGCYVYGNLMSLLDKDDYTTQTELTAPYTFRRLFRNKENLYNHPSKQLCLPATTLSDNCYLEMFSGCTNLTEAPVMNVTTVGKSSCKQMFYNCTNLTTAPTLSATALDENCYEDMFYDCANLTEAPSMNITSVANSCCSQMFRGCSSLTTVPIQLSATTLAQKCYQYMFFDCSSLTDAPATLGAETLAPWCCYLMFAYCTSLTTAPTLPGTTLASNCYNAMFRGCSSLTTAPELPATTLATVCYAYMFQESGLTTAPLLPATALVTSCYQYMFHNCSNLNSVTCFAQSGIDQNSSTYNWLNGVASTGIFTKAIGATWTLNSPSGIPTGWTVETAAPEGAINGKFSVSTTQQVWFSQGNLQATTTNGGTNWSWAFAENQYDRIGNATANNAINGNGTVSNNGTVDLFGWSTTANFYGINNNSSDYSGDFVDWGTNAISNGGNQPNVWRTLTKDEWGYLFNNRTTAAGTAPSIGGTDDARFVRAYLFGTKHGIILFPDNYVHPTGVAYPTGINQTNNTSWNANTYSAADWSKMEQAGAVFLTVAGGRLGSSIVNVDIYGLYRSATSYDSTRAYCVQFNNTSLDAVYYNYNRYFGASVRLVRDANSSK